MILYHGLLFLLADCSLSLMYAFSYLKISELNRLIISVL